MREALRAAGGLLTAAVAVVVMSVVALNGCGEETEEDNTGGMLGGLKVPEAVRAAPSLVAGTPSVTAVGFYRNYQLTREVEGSVSVGDTVWMKVVFSEPMKLVVSDGNEARPILYRKRSGEGEALVRFRMAAHGSGGEDFVSGDAKPLQNRTDAYICKYTVVPEDEGKQIAFMVGKFSVDRDGNPLAAFYRSPTKLQVGETEPETSEDTTAPTVVSVIHYHSGTPLEAGATVIQGSVVRTEVLFSEPMKVLPRRGHAARPVLSYTLDGTTEPFSVSLSRTVSLGHCRPSRNNTLFTCKVQVEGDYTVTIGTASTDAAGNTLAEASIAPTLAVIPRPVEPEPVSSIPESEPIGGEIVPSQRDFSGRVFVPNVNMEAPHGKYEARRFAQPISGVTVTIASGSRSGENTITDQNGRYIFQSVHEDELHLRVEKAGFETKEVIAYRSRQTTLANGDVPNHYKDPQKEPGNILIGHTWPDAARPLLQRVRTAIDPLFIIADLRKESGGSYNSGVVIIDKNIFPKYADHMANILAHEIAHMHQSASIYPDGWVNTPEGIAFAEARQKDWDEFGKAQIDRVPGFSSLYENAAETFAYYWTGENRRLYGNLRVTAPNRYKWAQEWLNK